MLHVLHYCHLQHCDINMFVHMSCMYNVVLVRFSIPVYNTCSVMFCCVTLKRSGTIIIACIYKIILGPPAKKKKWLKIDSTFAKILVRVN